MSLGWDYGVLFKGFELKGISNMNQKGCFLKALHNKNLAKKRWAIVKLKKKKRIETNDSFFFVNADGGKVRKPIVIVKNKKLVFLNR